jgi:hypothetical protein
MTKKKLIKTIEDSGCELIMFKAEFMFPAELVLNVLKHSDTYFSTLQDGIEWKDVNFHKVLVIGGALKHMSEPNDVCVSTDLEECKKKEVV